MPLHDWTRVPAGLFHHFHQSWSIRIADALNAGLLPQGAVALVEQRAGSREGDVLAIESRRTAPFDIDGGGGVAVEEPQVAQVIRLTKRQLYVRRANRIVVRHHLGRIIAVIEIISPGNKDTRTALWNFVAKTIEFLEAGVHILIVDPFPPTPRDPFGIHKAIWDELEERPFELPAGKDRILVSYKAGDVQSAYVEPVAVGETLPVMPLFLTGDLPRNLHVKVPLESTYQATWEATPQELRLAVETGVLPDPEAD